MCSLRAPQDIFNVAEITRQIKGVLGNNFAEVWVRGEVSNCKTQASGHVYFSLKDAEAQLSCVLFRSSAARLKFPIRDGMRLLVFGRIDVYEPRGAYQLIGQTALENGVGTLQLEFERLRQRLEQEGLFDPDRKKPLPRWAGTLGFVTSPTGAVIRDFLSILRRGGWNGRLILLPASVQGPAAAPEIARQIKRAQQLGQIDLLVVGRGGGSLEDLWPFNEEVVVRAVAACTIPTISAVGHQTDFTLCDFAADLRAETPSAAAGHIVDARDTLLAELETARDELYHLTGAALEDCAHALEIFRHRLTAQHPGHGVERAFLRLDDLTGRLFATGRQALHRLRESLDETVLKFWRQDPSVRLEKSSLLFESLTKRLAACSVEGTLKRGFVLLADAEGGIISRKKQLVPGSRIHARFHDGNTQLDVPEKI